IRGEGTVTSRRVGRTDASGQGAHPASGGARHADRVLWPDGPHGGPYGEACIQDSTLLLGHLGALLAGLREADGDGLLRIGDLLLRLPAALELTLLHLVHRLLDLLLRLG